MKNYLYSSKYFKIFLESDHKVPEYKIRYYTNKVSTNHDCLLEFFDITGIIYKDLKIGILVYQNEL